MKAFWSYFISIVFVALALLIVPIDGMFDEVMDTDKLIANAKQADLYEHLSKLTAQKISGLERFEKLKNPSLMPDTDEIQKAIESAFTAEWFYNILRSTHREMIGLISKPAPTQNYFIGIDLRDRKNLLSENLTLLIAQKLNALPECAPQDLLKMKAKAQRTRGSLYFWDITCKPPEPVLKNFKRALSVEFDKAMSILPDSLRILSDENNRLENGSGFQNLRAVYSFSKSFAAIGYSLLFLLLLIIAWINLNDRRLLLFRTGVPLILTGTVMSLPFIYVLTKANVIFTSSTMRFSLAQSTDDPITDEAVKLLVSIVKSMAQHYSWNMIYLSATVLAFGIVLIAISRYMNLSPLSHLDQRHETNL
jgi:hypothetical protein